MLRKMILAALTALPLPAAMAAPLSWDCQHNEPAGTCVGTGTMSLNSDAGMETESASCTLVAGQPSSCHIDIVREGRGQNYQATRPSDSTVDSMITTLVPGVTPGRSARIAWQKWKCHDAGDSGSCGGSADITVTASIDAYVYSDASNGSMSPDGTVHYNTSTGMDAVSIAMQPLSLPPVNAANQYGPSPLAWNCSAVPGVCIGSARFLNPVGMRGVSKGPWIGILTKTVRCVGKTCVISINHSAFPTSKTGLEYNGKVLQDWEWGATLGGQAMFGGQSPGQPHHAFWDCVSGQCVGRAAFNLPNPLQGSLQTSIQCRNTGQEASSLCFERVVKGNG